MLLIKNIDIASKETFIGIASSLEEAKECIINYLAYYNEKAEDSRFTVEDVLLINGKSIDYKLSSADEFRIKYKVEASIAGLNSIVPKTYIETFNISVATEKMLYGYDYFPLVFVNECIHKPFWEISEKED